MDEMKTSSKYFKPVPLEVEAMGKRFWTQFI